MVNFDVRLFMKPQVKRALRYGAVILVPIPVMGAMYISCFSDLQFVLEIYGSLLMFLGILVAVVLVVAFLGDKFLKMFRELFLSLLPPKKRELRRLKIAWDEADYALAQKQEIWERLCDKYPKECAQEKEKSAAYESYCKAMSAAEEARSRYYKAIEVNKRQWVPKPVSHEEYCKAVVAEIGRLRIRRKKMWDDE